MSIRALFLGAVAALVTLPALAADIDGKWNATVDSPQGPINLVFEFKAAAEKLEGTLSADMIPPTAISDGVVKGENVSFKLSLQFDPAAPSLVIDYQGTLKGDDLALVSKLDMGQGPVEMSFVAKRAK
jgi:hypothetical protein